MTTVTGLTAERMLAIEAASVVDGDVDGSGNLILTKHDGTQINAGSVKGPKGDPGPVGQDLSVISGIQIAEVGMVDQIRAGRQLTAADFGNLGLNPPAGLWNLSDLTDVSGNGRNLINKGAVGFASGINGLANTAAQFTGQAGQALYIPDSGAGDLLRLRTGSWGCWFRVARNNAYSMLVDKYAAVGTQDYSMYVSNTGTLCGTLSPDGTANQVLTSPSYVADDRSHFGVCTFDGGVQKLYLDGALENLIQLNYISMNPSASVFNIGNRTADASNNGTFQCYARIDEAFVTPDVLSEEQVRLLYCAKISHTLGATPVRISLNVHRKRKGATLAVSDFPTQPLRLHNFSAGSLGDQGSNNQALTNNGGSVAVAGADGSAGNAMLFYAPTPVTLSATDAGLPAALAPRSFGCWFKATFAQIGGVACTLVSLGGSALGVGDARIGVNLGNIFFTNGSDAITGGAVADGAWHHAVAVDDNAAIDGFKRKLYIDGKLAISSTVMNAITLSGANGFRIGAAFGSGQAFSGNIDGVFVCDYVLTVPQILALYAKGGQDLGASPKHPGDHVERLSATDLLAIFDTLDSQHAVDLAVA